MITIVEQNQNISRDLKQKLKAVSKVSFVPSFEKLTKEHYSETKVLAINPDLINWNVPISVLDKFKDLKYICVATTSVEMLNLDYCESKGIKIKNVANYSTQAVAEYAIWMMLSLARKLPIILNHKYDYTPKFLQTEIKGKTAGIIGYGHIGKEIARLCHGLGMNIVVYSPHSKSKKFTNMALDDILRVSDVIFPSYTGNEETKQLLKDKSFKRGAFVVSITGAIPIRYLKDLVMQKRLGGLAYEAEKMITSDFNIFTPPPLAWYTTRSLERGNKKWIDNIINAYKD